MTEKAADYTGDDPSATGTAEGEQQHGAEEGGKDEAHQVDLGEKKRKRRRRRENKEMGGSYRGGAAGAGGVIL